MDNKRIRELMQVMNRYDMATLRLKSDDYEIEIESVKAFSNGSLSLPISSSGGAPSLNSSRPDLRHPQVLLCETSSSPAGSSAVEKNQSFITSELVGTFYRAPKPGEAPFVTEGSRIAKGQVIGIVEAMKVLNEVHAGMDGTIEEFLIEDGGAVEFGTHIARLAE